jgi:hypothetical protein
MTAIYKYIKTMVLFLLLIGIGAVSKAATVQYPAPTQVGDIVARDLNVPFLWGFGHIGMWDGTGVVESLNAYNASGSAVQRNTWKSFETNSSVWPTLHPAYGTHSIWGCFSMSCISYDAHHVNTPHYGKSKGNVRWAMAARANQIIQIGSNYSYTNFVKRALPTITDSADYCANLFCTAKINKTTTYPPQRGSYRCDTLVMELLYMTVPTVLQANAVHTGSMSNYTCYGCSNLYNNNWDYLVTEMDPINFTWINKINTIDTPLPAPVTLYNAISSVLK